MEKLTRTLDRGWSRRPPGCRAAGLLGLVAGCLVGMIVGMVVLPAPDAAFLAGWLAYPVVGGVILLRQPGHHVGWFTLARGPAGRSRACRLVRSSSAARSWMHGGA